MGLNSEEGRERKRKRENWSLYEFWQLVSEIGRNHIVPQSMVWEFRCFSRCPPRNWIPGIEKQVQLPCIYLYIYMWFVIVLYLVSFHLANDWATICQLKTQSVLVKNTLKTKQRAVLAELIFDRAYRPDSKQNSETYFTYSTTDSLRIPQYHHLHVQNLSRNTLNRLIPLKDLQPPYTLRFHSCIIKART